MAKRPDDRYRSAGELAAAARAALEPAQVITGHPVKISSIAIIPGYAKTDPANGTDRYRQNRRLTEVQYLTDDATAITHRLDAAPDHRAEQVIDAGDAVSRRLTVRLVASQPGEPDHGQPASDTVAISELIVTGR